MAIKLAETERQAQRAVVQYVRLKYPDVLIWHNANGGSRARKEYIDKKTGKKKRYSPEGKALRADGVLAGVPDLFVAKQNHSGIATWHSAPNKWTYGYSGLFIEMKSKKGKLSDSQVDVINKLSAEGYKCEVCYSSEEAMKVIDEYLS